MLNKTFRLFISSTFSDFISERNILNDKIFPAVDDYCQRRGYNFQLVDLRWGVTNESALNQNTLAICLDEVRRCKKISPKPNFLLMAGERYGWVPLPTNIPTKDFEDVLSVASPEEKQILTEWYLLDENKIGGEYYLKNRRGEYTDDALWGRTEKVIYDALENCIVNKLKADEDKVRELTSSATEKEIIEGLLECEGISDNTIALFRSNYPEKDENQERINNLKKRIVEKMSSEGYSSNVLELDYNSDYEKQFEEIITSTLIKNIETEIIRLSRAYEEIDEKEELNIVFDSAGVVYDRSDETKRLNDYINSDNNKPLYLYGDSGSGKTTLLAQFVQNSTDHIFFSFCGLGENSFTLLSSVQKLANDIKYHFEIQKGFYVNEFNLSEVFLYALNSIPKEEKAVIIIDGFEMFHDIAEIKERVVPANLPPNVKMIISSANLDVIKRLSDDDSQIYKLEWLDSVKSENLFNLLLKQKDRCIASAEQKEIVSDVLKNGATPLQLKMMSEECLAWHSSEVVEAFPDYVEAIALRHITNMFIKFGHNKELVLYALALICAAPYGIAEEELQTLLLRFDSVRSYFVSEDRYKHSMEKLPFAIWSRLFYDLKGCLTLVRVKGIVMVKFTHQVFYRVFLKQFESYYNEATEILVSYYEQEPNYAKDNITPNKRKALAFAELLKKTGNIQKLAEILADLEYVDSVIKIGNANEVLFNLQYVMKNLRDENVTADLKIIYTCIQKNRIMLNCYTGEFWSCIQSYVPSDDEDVTVGTEVSVVENSIFFPYSSDSAISWSPDGQKYAVFNSSYVYVCSAESNSELCRIYLEPTENATITTDYVLWLDETVIGIVTKQRSIVVYDFSDYIPNLIFSKKSEAFVFADKFRAEYSLKNNLLLIQSGRNINAYDYRTNEERFSIRLGTGGAYNSLEYDFDEDENCLYIRDHKKYIRVFSLSNGELLKIIRIKSGNSQDMINKPDVHIIDENRFLLYSGKSRNRFAVFDTSVYRLFYLHPPYYEKINSLVIGGRYLIFVYTDLLLIVDFLNNYDMKWLCIPGINNVSWKIKDECFSVLSDGGFRVYSVEEFNPFSEDIMCFPLKQNLFKSLFLAHKSLKRDFKILPSLLGMRAHLNNILEYRYILKIKDDDLQNEELDTNANIVVFSDDGKIAVAYEEMDTIIIYDIDNGPILQIDKLRFAISNDLLKMCFSPDSKYLLLWRNDSVQVIELTSGKVKLELDILWRPALDVDFGDDSDTLKILLCDGVEYCCKISEGKKGLMNKIPEKLVQDFHMDAYFGPYNYFKNSDGKYETVPYLHSLDFDYNSSIKSWFNDTRCYRGENQWLYYENGEFFLNGDRNKVFSHEFFDFGKSHQLQKLQESKAVRYYLAEKNDLFSKLFENGKYLVLVSRMLNSVIIFDTELMTVTSAYKPQGNIIGCIENKENCYIELIFDREPYSTTLSLYLDK